MADHDVTGLLIEWSGGNRAALSQLMPLVYQELHRVAKRQMSNQRSNHTLQATALINEAYVRLVADSSRQWQGRTHFFAIAATAMRHILVDHSRASQAAKRGGNKEVIPIELANVGSNETCTDLVALDEALTELSQLNARQSKVVELRYFGGLSVSEAATTLGISPETVMRDWRAAKNWLFLKLQGTKGQDPGE